MATVVLSVDAELAWGFHDLPGPPRDRYEGSREGWLTLLDLCDEFEIPATWAVVGHLLLDDCDGTHEDHPTPPGWFDHEKGRRRVAEEYRFGDGLVDAIRNADVDHDLGSHTFSHVELGDAGTSRELADAEVERSVEIAAENGIDVDSFVFPRNRVGHRDVLADHGITCYRGTAPTDHDGSEPRRLQEKLARAAGRSHPPLVEPSIDEHGLVNVPASLYLFSFEGLARSVAEPVVGDPVVTQVRRGLRAASDRDGLFHLWLHPNNVSSPRDVDRMRRVFAAIDRERARSSLEVKTMAEVADRVLADGEGGREREQAGTA